MVIPKINIVRATENDAALIADLSTVTFLETYRGSSPDDDLITFIDECFNENVIAKELKDADDLYFIAFADGFPAGYIRLKEEGKEYPLEKKYNAIQLKRIYVLKEFQSQKVGAALMNYAIHFAAENMYELLWLGVWEGNEKALLFYNKWGFEDPQLEYKFIFGNTTHTDRWLFKFIGQH